MNAVDLDLVKEGLTEIADLVRVIFKSEYALVQCPFHKGGQEANPSLMVNLANVKFPVGFHYCLSCGIKGNWNKLAEAFDLETLTVEARHASLLTSNRSKNLFPVQNLELNSLKTPANTNKTKGKAISIKWPETDNWRGISGNLLAKLNCKLSLDKQTKEKQLILPVCISNMQVGFIAAFLQKKDKSLGSSYFNSSGSWVKEALFPYDYVKTLLHNEQRTAPICLVEGPRDALNLIQFGVPALAILGCTNWSKQSISLLMSCKFSKLIIMMDGDEAGRKAAAQIYTDLREFISTEKLINLQLPDQKDPADLVEKEIVFIKEQFS